MTQENTTSETNGSVVSSPNPQVATPQTSDHKELVSAYWQRVNRLSLEEREGSVGWFMKQLREVGHESPIRIENHAERVPEYLKVAYQSEVASRGMTMRDDEYTRRVISDVSRWLTSHRKPGLMLRGYIGVGKTTMLFATAAVMRIIGKQMIRVVDARRITSVAKESTKEFEELMKTPLLGIDDLGTEPQTVKLYGNELSPVAELLTERYKNRAFTIITTNLTTKRGDGGLMIDELQETYGDRLFDRFHEMFNTISYDAEQKSYRR